MAILVKCRCGEQFQTNDANAGRSANCPDCGRELEIPNPRHGAARRVEDIGGITSGKAIASLILGLISFVCVAITGIPAILYGLKAIAEINRDRGLTRGRGIATTGIVLGVFGSTVMTVVAVIPLIEQIRDSIAREACVSHLREIGLAFHNAHEIRGRCLPWAIPSKDGVPLLSWRVALLDSMGPAEKALYNRFHLDEPWDSPHNLALIPFMPSVYRAADRVPKRAGETHYQVILGKNTMFPGNEGIKFDEVTDGSSVTFLVVEGAKPVIWTKPDDLIAPTVAASFVAPPRRAPKSMPAIPGMRVPAVGGVHPGGFCALYVDGSVHWIDDSITPADFNALTTPKGSELLGTYY